MADGIGKEYFEPGTTKKYTVSKALDFRGLYRCIDALAHIKAGELLLEGVKDRVPHLAQS